MISFVSYCFSLCFPTPLLWCFCKFLKCLNLLLILESFTSCLDLDGSFSVPVPSPRLIWLILTYSSNFSPNSNVLCAWHCTMLRYDNVVKSLCSHIFLVLNRNLLCIHLASNWGAMLYFLLTHSQFVKIHIYVCIELFLNFPH